MHLPHGPGENRVVLSEANDPPAIDHPVPGNHSVTQWPVEMHVVIPCSVLYEGVHLNERVWVEEL